MARQDEYRRSGVDYDVLDEVKREAIALAAATAPLLAASSGSEISESRGSSAYVFEVNGTTLALVVEGLGTKSIIASDYLDATGISRFADIAQDAVAAIVNDVISVGAHPLVVTAYFATGDAAWYGKRERSLDLLNGWRKACEEAGAVWGGGESPALPGVITPGAIELAGSAVGLVPTGRRPVLGRDIAVGDQYHPAAEQWPARQRSIPGPARCLPVARGSADRAAERQAPGRRAARSHQDLRVLRAGTAGLAGRAQVPQRDHRPWVPQDHAGRRCRFGTRSPTFRRYPRSCSSSWTSWRCRRPRRTARSTWARVMSPSSARKTWTRPCGPPARPATTPWSLARFSKGDRALAIPSLGIEYRDDDFQLR